MLREARHRSQPLGERFTADQRFVRLRRTRDVFRRGFQGGFSGFQRDSAIVGIKTVTGIAVLGTVANDGGAV